MNKFWVLFSVYQLAFGRREIANWENCSPDFPGVDHGEPRELFVDKCLPDSNGNEFICCEAPGGDGGKTTCRPHWECHNNHLPNWKTCHFGDTCAPDDQGNEFKCCVAYADVGWQPHQPSKRTCRLPSECYHD